MINKENGFDLNIGWRFPGGGIYIFAFIALFALLIVIYGNSFQGQFVFDDIHNIVENKNIFLKTLDLADIQKTFYGTQGNTLNRPFAYFSFALNYYFGGLNVVGYHIINFIIHFLTSIFLFLFIYNTLKLPIILERYGPTSYSIALLATFFWASSPVQVTSVTYIVQRMASMAGLFYIMAMYFYLKGRTSPAQGRQIGFFTGALLCALLSFATKENAVLLPVSIWIYDLLLVEGATRENIIKNLKFFAPMILIVAAIGFLYVDISSIIDGSAYKNRPFTLTERLLTQPRIVIFYISILFYPISSRLALLHDVELSKSLLTPWSTLPAIAFIVILLIFAGYVVRKKPLISFCILFYFINHFIESSFIPLEIIYEHRNYIPSMFLFVPMAILIIAGLDYFAYKKSLQFLIFFIMTLMLISQGHTVYMQNGLYRDPEMLWKDNINKYPYLSRPHGSLGLIYAMRGDYAKAMMETKTALLLSKYPNLKQLVFDHVNMGSFYFLLERNYEMALFHYNEALRIQPQNSAPFVYHNMAIIMLNYGNLELAREYGRRGVVYAPHNEESHSNLALILLKAGNLNEAIGEADKAIELKPDSIFPLAILGEAFRLEGNYARSEYCWMKFLKKEPNHIAALLATLELYHLMDDKKKLLNTAGKLLYLSGDGKILDMIKTSQRKDFAYTPDPKKLIPIFQKVFLQLACDFTRGISLN